MALAGRGYQSNTQLDDRGEWKDLISPPHFPSDAINTTPGHLLIMTHLSFNLGLLTVVYLSVNHCTSCNDITS